MSERRAINLKRLRMEVVEHRYQGKEYPIEKAVLLQLIDELAIARENLVYFQQQPLRDQP